MTEREFWEIIQSTDSAEYESRIRALRNTLDGLPPDEIVAFDRQLWALIDRAYDWDLWGAAYCANGGCGDDMFDYFRAWLVSCGERVYSAVTARPDELVNYLPDDFDELDFEAILYVTCEAYENKTGTEFSAPSRDRQPSPRGEEWDFDDDAEVRKRLPRLYARIEADEGPAEKRPWWHFW